MPGEAQALGERLRGLREYFDYYWVFFNTAMRKRADAHHPTGSILVENFASISVEKRGVKVLKLI